MGASLLAVAKRYSIICPGACGASWASVRKQYGGMKLLLFPHRRPRPSYVSSEYINIHMDKIG